MVAPLIILVTYFTFFSGELFGGQFTVAQAKNSLHLKCRDQRQTARFCTLKKRGSPLGIFNGEKRRVAQPRILPPLPRNLPALFLLFRARCTPFLRFCRAKKSLTALAQRSRPCFSVTEIFQLFFGILDFMALSLVAPSFGNFTFWQFNRQYGKTVQLKGISQKANVSNWQSVMLFQITILFQNTMLFVNSSRQFWSPEYVIARDSENETSQKIRWLFTLLGL